MSVSGFIEHVEENVGRYSIVAIGVLTPAAGLLGQVADNLGGHATPTGRTVLGASAAVSVLLSGAVWLHNLGKWQMARDFGKAADLAIGEIEAAVKPDNPDAEADKPKQSAADPATVAS